MQSAAPSRPQPAQVAGRARSRAREASSPMPRPSSAMTSTAGGWQGPPIRRSPGTHRGITRASQPRANGPGSVAVPDHVDRRFRDQAAAAGMLDVAYDFADSPIGTLLVATSERGVCRISFDPEPERELTTLAKDFGVRVLRSPGPVEGVRRELHEYFEGSRR